MSKPDPAKPEAPRDFILEVYYGWDKVVPFHRYGFAEHAPAEAAAKALARANGVSKVRLTGPDGRQQEVPGAHGEAPPADPRPDGKGNKRGKKGFDSIAGE